ncbi:PREDICTED: biotin--protein ligase isoform X3 [Dinoponera quadriceps]|nr:PREDICTED: biotin--protein ligase isoform X3 [Dinoponera quadriceps]
MHILVEAAFGAREVQASTIAAKLEDYGLITAWTANPDSIDFILETDIDHITNFMIAIVGEQYYINNRVSFTCIQSVAVSGRPCSYNIEDPNSSSTANAVNAMQIDWDTYVEKLMALSEAAQEASRKQIPQKITGYDVYPQNEETDAEKTLPTTPVESVKKSIDLNDTENDTETSETSHLRSTTDDRKKHDLESSVTPINASAPSKEAHTASSVTKGPGASAIAQSYDAMKRKDNILSSTSNEISTKDTYQSKSTVETRNLQAPFTLKGDEKSSGIVKPPNVVIYADSPDAINNVKTVLGKALDPDRYIIYALSRETACSNVWIDQVALVVICGNVDSEVKIQLVEYVVRGGKLLALCSDMLHTLLPSFKTAEVRESELVYFSYGKWKHMRMMHHIFCYHASPVRARFSQDQEDIRAPGLNPPASTSVKDKKGNSHSFNVKVLGTEETWHNPSILLATLASSGGKVVFSQIHLEVDPTQYEYEEDKFKALKESNAARLEIISDLLSTHLGMQTSQSAAQADVQTYTPAYFLGRYEDKIELLKKLKPKMQPFDLLKMSRLSIQFCSKFNELQRIAPSASCLPILIHGCPDNFSTTKYFERLDTKKMGRLVIYADVLTSSMHVTDCTSLEHGLAVIPRQQTEGQGRSGNLWLSPIGCTMFTLQMHLDMNSVIGGCISLIQHYVAVAIVHAIRSKPGYENINLRLKWPNDIYIGNSKIGGLLVKTKIDSTKCICDIGAGINLSNSKPTLCINTAIQDYNQKHGTNLLTFSYEEFVAEVFNCIEYLVDRTVYPEDTKFFYELYYKYWLHEDSHVTVVKQSGETENVVIKGIDGFGYLLVEDGKGKRFSLHPDGNTFDLLKGLISPK